MELINAVLDEADSKRSGDCIGHLPLLRQSDKYTYALDDEAIVAMFERHSFQAYSAGILSRKTPTAKRDHLCRLRQWWTG
jgi:hypothetical protein